MPKQSESLPVGWAACSIGDIIPKPRVKVKPNKDSKLPFIGMDHIEAESFHLIGQDEFKNMKSAGSPFSPDDVLYGRLRPYLNKVHCAKFEGVASAEFIVLPSSDTHDSNFIKYLLHHIRFVQYANEKSSGDRPRIKFDRLAEYDFSLPPHAEQERIVDKIDELFSAIEAGERAIEQARIGVARYRKAILKAAVTGELTRDWRDENAAKESAEDLLARILTARYEAWEKAELAKLDVKGKARPETLKQWKKFRGRYKPPVEPDTDGLAKFPETWIWVSLPQMGEFGRGKSKHRPRGHPSLYGGDYPFLQTGRVRNSKGRIRTYDKTYNEKGLAQSRLWPKGTVCITIAANIAETGILEFDACFPDSVVGLIPHSDLGPEYPEFFLRTAKDNLDRYAPATAQKNINLGILETVCVPFPPKDEQTEIVDRVEKALSKADAVEATLDAQSRAAKALKQAVLKTAFEGKLVPQNPNDEPASELLKRIKEET